MTNRITMEKLTELIEGMDIARSTVYVSALALDQGETDLELQSAKILKRTADTLDEVYDELVSMRNDAQPARRLKGTAAIVLDAGIRSP